MGVLYPQYYYLNGITPVTMNAEFIDRLKELKETFKENLNEVCPKEETDVPERLKRLL